MSGPRGAGRARTRPAGPAATSALLRFDGPEFRGIPRNRSAGGARGCRSRGAGEVPAPSARAASRRPGPAWTDGAGGSGGFPASRPHTPLLRPTPRTRALTRPLPNTKHGASAPPLPGLQPHLPAAMAVQPACRAGLLPGRAQRTSAGSAILLRCQNFPLSPPHSPPQRRQRRRQAPALLAARSRLPALLGGAGRREPVSPGGPAVPAGRGRGWRMPARPGAALLISGRSQPLPAAAHGPSTGCYSDASPPHVAGSNWLRRSGLFRNPSPE